MDLYEYVMGAPRLFIVLWIHTFVVTTLSLMYNYKKLFSANLAILDSIKIVIFPSFLSALVTIVLIGLNPVFQKLGLVPNSMQSFLITGTLFIATIFGVMVLYKLLRNKLIKKYSAELDFTKTLAIDTIVLYGCFLIGRISIYLF